MTLYHAPSYFKLAGSENMRYKTTNWNSFGTDTVTDKKNRQNRIVNSKINPYTYSQQFLPRCQEHTKEKE